MAGPPLTSGSAACAVPPAASTSPNGPTPRCSAYAPTRTPWSPSPSTWPRVRAVVPPPGCAPSASTPSYVSPSVSAVMPNSSTTTTSDTSNRNRSSPTKPGPSWGKKDKHCDPLDPADACQGSYWDHVIIDADTKLIVSLVVGRRDADTVVQVFTDFYGRTDGALPELISTDEYAVYETVILDTYGLWLAELGLTEQEWEEDGWSDMPAFYFPVEITYATVHKEREKGRVVEVTEQVVLGSEEQAEQTLAESEQSQTINTSFVERWFGTQRQFNARKKRKAYTFSKELSFHEACTWLVVVWYNFGWCVRTLRQKIQEEPRRYHHRTPAMAAGLSDHPWTMQELLTYPLYPAGDGTPDKKVRTYDEVLERLKGVERKLAPAPEAL